MTVKAVSWKKAQPFTAGSRRIEAGPDVGKVWAFTHVTWTRLSLLNVTPLSRERAREPAGAPRGGGEG